MRDYSEVTATAARDLDKLKQLLRDKKYRKAELAAEEYGANFIRLAMWCQEAAEIEESRPKITLGQELMRGPV